MSQRRLLFFSQVLAVPNYHGGCVYPHALLMALHRQGVAIDYAWLGRPLAGGRRIMRNPLKTRFVSRSWVRGARNLGRILIPDTVGACLFRRAVQTDFPDVGGEHLSTPDEQAFAAQIIRRISPSAVLIDGTCNLPMLDSLSPAERSRFQVGVLTHNLQSRRTDLYRAHAQPLDFLPMTAAAETELLARADLVIAIQDREAAEFRRMLPHHEIVTVPMPIEPRPQPPERAIAGRCLFVGGSSGHNIEAVQWLLRTIWPLVRAGIPEAELIIAGTVGRAVAPSSPGVRVVGPLTDLSVAYAESSLSLVPLPMGTGLKIKLVEAMGFGRPVVTTAAGAEGFAELELGNVAVVADNETEFAAAVIRLLRSDALRQQVIERQRAWIDRVLEPVAATAPLKKLWRT